MLNKVAVSVIVLGLSSHWCLAQIPKPSQSVVTPKVPLVSAERWSFDFVDRPYHTILFQEYTTPLQTKQTNQPLKIKWSLTELTSQLSDLNLGTSHEVAVQRILILGGKEDGGLQSIPPTRYYFESGILVNIPLKDGFLIGPLRITPGLFSCD